MDGPNQLQIEESKEVLEILFEMSQILNCGLNRETISILATLVEKGANPQALIEITKKIRGLNFSQENRGTSSNFNLSAN